MAHKIQGVIFFFKVEGKEQKMGERKERSGRKLNYRI